MNDPLDDHKDGKYAIGQMTFSQESIATHVFEIGSTLIYFLIKKNLIWSFDRSGGYFHHFRKDIDISRFHKKMSKWRLMSLIWYLLQWYDMAVAYCSFNQLNVTYIHWSHLGFEFMGPLKKQFFSYYFHIDNRWCTVHVRLAYDKDSLSRVLAQYRYLGMCYPQEKMLR